MTQYSNGYDSDIADIVEWLTNSARYNNIITPELAPTRYTLARTYKYYMTTQYRNPSISTAYRLDKVNSKHAVTQVGTSEYSVYLYNTLKTETVTIHNVLNILKLMNVYYMSEQE